MSTGTLAGQSSAGTSAPAGEEQSTRGVVSAYEAAWNRHDMSALADLFAEDAEWVNIVGMWWRGKAAVVKAHTVFHEIMFRDTPLHFTDVAVRSVAPGIAVVIGTVQVGSFATPDGRTMPASGNRLTLVVAQRQGQWQIVSGHNTVIDPIAAPHDPVNQQ